ncbi:acetylglutamate kinase [Candidatus Aerophobetes bacterium]|nr:acetylglutamate kinase [Candidatus Aerophobetes bacterium]
MVIKYGGKAWLKEDLKRKITEDVVLMKYVGIRPVLVHGGGEAITEMMKRLQLEPRFIEGNRVTDRETMEVVEMVLVGKINKEIVSLINQLGARAVGLEGKDGQLILARRCKNKNLGLVGEVERINSLPIKILEEGGFIPVIAPIGVTLQGETLNINADLVAAEIACALRAEKLIFLTDVEGIMRDSSGRRGPISTLRMGEIDTLIKEGKIQEGMMAKVRACQRALKGGVKKVHIISGEIPHSLLLEVFTDTGIGTQVIK